MNDETNYKEMGLTTSNMPAREPGPTKVERVRGLLDFTKAIRRTIDEASDADIADDIQEFINESIKDGSLPIPQPQGDEAAAREIVEDIKRNAGFDLGDDAWTSLAYTLRRHVHGLSDQHRRVVERIRGAAHALVYLRSTVSPKDVSESILGLCDQLLTPATPDPQHAQPRGKE